MVWFLRISLWSIVAFGIRADDASQCVQKVSAMIITKDPEFLHLTLSTGKSLPYDAGKYVMCIDGGKTRYFLVSAQAHFPGKTPSPPIAMKMGFCMPDVCDDAGMVALFNTTLPTPSGGNIKLLSLFISELEQIQVTNITATSPQLDLKSEDLIGIISAIAVASLITLVAVSTCIVQAAKAPPAQPAQQQLLDDSLNDAASVGTDGTSVGSRTPPLNPREPTARTPRPQGLASKTVFQAFSLIGSKGTLPKLFESTPYEPTHCLNGIRVINMAWIILGHTFLMPTGISGYANTEDIVVNSLNENVAERNPLFQIILAAQAGVDTFFFLSGFLLAFLTLKELRRGKMKIHLALMMRYFRLTPSLALIMVVFFKIWVFFGYGPFAATFQSSINERCEGSWWSELTYTLNFIPFDSNKVCMGWTWYLGDDMVFFIITILLLPVYHRSKLLGWFVISALTCISFGVTTYLVVKYDLSIYVFDDHYTKYSYWAYSKPYCRIPAYFVGIMAAWLLTELEDRGITRQNRPNTPCARMAAKIAAFISLSVLAFVVFIVWTDFGDGKNSWGIATNVIYINFSRPIFAMAWAVLTLLCYYDYLPFIDAFLSHPCWTPMARLTYGAYLVHPLVIKLAAGRSVQFYTFDAMDIAYRFAGNFVLAHLGSMALWVLCERPCITFSSAFRAKKGAERQPRVEQGVSIPKVES